MILSAIAEKLKRRSKGDFTGRHFDAALDQVPGSGRLKRNYSVLSGPDSRAWRNRSSVHLASISYLSYAAVQRYSEH